MSCSFCELFVMQCITVHHGLHRHHGQHRYHEHLCHNKHHKNHRCNFDRVQPQLPLFIEKEMINTYTYLVFKTQLNVNAYFNVNNINTYQESKILKHCPLKLFLFCPYPHQRHPYSSALSMSMSSSVLNQSHSSWTFNTHIAPLRKKHNFTTISVCNSQRTTQSHFESTMSTFVF